MSISGVDDTDRETRDMVTARYRNMTPAQRLECVADLNRSVLEMARIDARHRQGW